MDNPIEYWQIDLFFKDFQIVQKELSTYLDYEHCILFLKYPVFVTK